MGNEKWEMRNGTIIVRNYYNKKLLMHALCSATFNVHPLREVE